MQASTPDSATTCYRHPRRETGVSCSACGRPICPACMTPTSVGMRCPECAGQKTKVRTVASLQKAPELTYALIGICVIVYVAMVATGGAVDPRGTVIYDNLALNPQKVANGEWWRIITAGFLHYGPLHIAFNMYVLYFLGTLLEPMIGKLRFGLIYFVSLLGGSFGALLEISAGNVVGASGAVFGLMGASFLALRARGIDPMQTGIGITLLLNLAITFLIPGISKGGHIGGLIAGVLVSYLLFGLGQRGKQSERVVLAACGAIGVALAIGCLAAV